MSGEDNERVLPLWARLRLAHEFADEEEKKEIESLANEILARHPDVEKTLNLPDIANLRQYCATILQTCLHSLYGISCEHHCQSFSQTCSHSHFTISCEHICQSFLQICHHTHICPTGIHLGTANIQKSPTTNQTLGSKSAKKPTSKKK